MSGGPHKLNEQEKAGVICSRPDLLKPVRRFLCWLWHDSPQAFGTLLLGVSAFCALIQTKDFVKSIFHIEQVSEKMDSTLLELRQISVEIKNGVAELRLERKEKQTAKIFDENPALKKQNADLNALKNSLESLPGKPILTPGHSTIFLPFDVREDLVQKLRETKDINRRSQIFQDSLKIYTAP